MHYLMILTALFTQDTCESARVVYAGSDSVIISAPQRGYGSVQIGEDIRFKDMLATYDPAGKRIVCKVSGPTQADVEKARQEGRAEVKAAVLEAVGRF